VAFKGHHEKHLPDTYYQQQPLRVLSDNDYVLLKVFSVKQK